MDVDKYGLSHPRRMVGWVQADQIVQEPTRKIGGGVPNSRVAANPGFCVDRQTRQRRPVNSKRGTMSKKRRERGDEVTAVRETGGLTDTNCGIILADIVATRSWSAVITIILLMGIFVRTAVGLGGYSGTTTSLSVLWTGGNRR